MRGIIEIETQVARLQDADKKFATLRSLDFNWLTAVLIKAKRTLHVFKTVPFGTLLIDKDNRWNIKHV